MSVNSHEEGRHVDGETPKERHEQLRHLQKEAFQLANYYFVFQGVIFTASYNTPSNLKCRYHWVPFTLSFLAGFLNLCSLLTIAFKYKATLDDIDRDAIADEGQTPGREPNVVRFNRYYRCCYVVFCMVLFCGFLGVTLAGSWIINCG